MDVPPGGFATRTPLGGQLELSSQVHDLYDFTDAEWETLVGSYMLPSLPEGGGDPAPATRSRRVMRKLVQRAV